MQNSKMINTHTHTQKHGKQRERERERGRLTPMAYLLWHGLAKKKYRRKEAGWNPH